MINLQMADRKVIKNKIISDSKWWIKVLLEETAISTLIVRIDCRWIVLGRRSPWCPTWHVGNVLLLPTLLVWSLFTWAIMSHGNMYLFYWRVRSTDSLAYLLWFFFIHVLLHFFQLSLSFTYQRGKPPLRGCCWTHLLLLINTGG